MNLDPLLLPEILSKVLEYADMNTLKASRLVSRFWNDEAGRVLPWSSSIDPYIDLYQVKPEPDERTSRLGDLNETLESSADPFKFFRNLVIGQNFAHKWEIWGDEDVDEGTVGRIGWTEILQKYGKYLNGLDCRYWNSSSSSLNGPAAQLLLFRGLSELCPLLQELYLTINFEWSSSTVPSLEFKARLNLRSIRLEIHCEIKKGIQDFLVQILAASTKLKALRIYVGDFEGTNGRLYQKLFALQEMTKKLSEFEWIGTVYEDDQDQNILSTIRFSSNQLKILTLRCKLEDPTSFPFLTNSIGSLKTLQLMVTDYYDERQAEIQSHLFQMVMKSLLSLETLGIGFYFCPHDHFFNADNLNAPPHQNLRRLLLPWQVNYNLFDINSVSNVVKWFPNLTLLSLCFGVKNTDLQTMEVGVGIGLQEAVGILSGLKRLKDLSLRLCGNTAPWNLHLAFKALQNIPSLERCTFVEFGLEWNKAESPGKTTYALEDFKYLKPLKHLSLIRLMGFKIIGEEKILNFAKENGIKLEFFNEPLSSLRSYHFYDDDPWLMTYP